MAPFGSDALAKSIHDADDVARPRGLLRRLRRHAGLLGADEFDDRVFVAVGELLRAEVSGLPFDDDVREVGHFLGQFHVGNFVEVEVLVAHLGAVAQNGADSPFPRGSNIMMRSRRAMTTLPSPTTFSSRIASRMIAKASSATRSLGAM